MSDALSKDPESLGSLIDFAAHRGHEPTEPQVRIDYSAALTDYRTRLAEARGITLEELHEGPLRDVGRIASEGITAETSTADAA